MKRHREKKPRLSLSLKVRDGARELLSPNQRAALRRKAVKISSGSVSTDAELSILLSDDVQVRALNASYRDKDETTDVLSFPTDEEPPPGEPKILGDIVISVEQAQRQAPDALESEILRLVAHGLCHLLGHDHLQPEERRVMRAAERERLARVGLDTGLIDAATA